MKVIRSSACPGHYMKTSNHQSSSPSYTLADLERLAEQWAIEHRILATHRWMVSNLLAWLARKEREANVDQKS